MNCLEAAFRTAVVTFQVGDGPGGGYDITARVIAPTFIDAKATSPCPPACR